MVRPKLAGRTVALLSFAPIIGGLRDPSSKGKHLMLVIIIVLVVIVAGALVMVRRRRA